MLIGIVIFSYRQTIYAYPQGGGSYIVSKDNLGTVPGLIAGASLLTDYMLTVAVSISAGVFAIISLVPPAWPPIASKWLPGRAVDHPAAQSAGHPRVGHRLLRPHLCLPCPRLLA